MSQWAGFFHAISELRASAKVRQETEVTAEGALGERACPEDDGESHP
jgi:hypothetical protein